VAQWQISGGRVRDRAELDAVLALRPRLAALWDMTEDEAVGLVNQLLREASALPQLVKHDGWEYHIHATSPDAPLADRMAVDAAMGIADVIRTGELSRLRVCAALDCDDVLVDLSKNRSRRFCGPTCANRVNVAAYRSRRNASLRQEEFCRQAEVVNGQAVRCEAPRRTHQAAARRLAAVLGSAAADYVASSAPTHHRARPPLSQVGRPDYADASGASLA
jgi:hypothetical protein